MILRSAGPGDAAALVDLARTSFTATFGHLYHPDDLAAFLAGHTLAGWQAELTDPAFAVHVGEMDGALVAYAKLGPPSLPVTPGAPASELRQFYVLGPWQGDGTARRLMDRVLATARDRGAAELYLSVFVDNERARRFYVRYGFVDIGRYDFRVGNHVDEDRLMRLSL